MSNPQEALKALGLIDLDKSSNGYDSPKYVKDFYFSEYETLQELVDKATPKKPIGKHTAYRCPVCGRRVRSGKGSSSFVKDNVCQKCYQVLDWSDEND